MACLLLAATTAAAAGGASDGDELVPVRLGQYRLAIPARYTQDSVIPAWLRWLPGLDNGFHDLLLTIDADEVAAAVPGYRPKDGRYVEDLHIRLVAYDETTKLDIDPQHFVPMWTGVGEMKGRILELDAEAGLVRSYRRIGSRDFWDIYLLPPGSETIPDNLYSYWVASCLKLGSPLTASGSATNCDSNVVADHIAVDLTVSEQNIPLIHQVRAYLRNLVLRWLADGATASD